MHACLASSSEAKRIHPPIALAYAGMLFYNDEGTENRGLVFVDTATRTATSWILAWLSPSIATGRALNLFSSGDKTRRTTSSGSLVGDRADRQSTTCLHRPRQRRRRQCLAHGIATDERESCYKSLDGTPSISFRCGRKGRQSARTYAVAMNSARPCRPKLNDRLRSQRVAAQINGVNP
jgi:hypothetical protein